MGWNLMIYIAVFKKLFKFMHTHTSISFTRKLNIQQKTLEKEQVVEAVLKAEASI